MEYKKGDMLELVIVDDISWGKVGDTFCFIRNSKKYDENKSLVVVDDNGKSHVVKEYRLAEEGNKKAIARCIANAPKFFAVLQDDCRNYCGERAIIGLDKAEEQAKGFVREGVPHTIYELKAVRKVTREPIVTEA